jgi:DNA-binding CsgD family transcriptional regulator
MRILILLLATILLPFCAKAQYRFSGHIDNTIWGNAVYLSIIDDYRKISGIHPEQIIAKVKTDSLGYFQFTGNQLDNQNRIYKIHVDNCFENPQEANHFQGECNNSKAVIFIARNTDSINFPLSFNKQMFCEIEATNKHANAFVKIDSLKAEMAFDYASYRSEANRKLNNKKWFTTFHKFGKNLEDPLAELYIYGFLSDKSSDLHEFYLNDLKQNAYYKNLETRLLEAYPNSEYSTPYSRELASDRYALESAPTPTWYFWTVILAVLLIVPLAFNIWLLKQLKTQKQSEKLKQELTKQEQNVLDLLLAGKTNKEIASELFVSLSTIKTHVNNIFKKLNIQSRNEAKTLFNK